MLLYIRTEMYVFVRAARVSRNLQLQLFYDLKKKGNIFQLLKPEQLCVNLHIYT